MRQVLTLEVFLASLRVTARRQDGDTGLPVDARTAWLETPNYRAWTYQVPVEKVPEHLDLLHDLQRAHSRKRAWTRFSEWLVDSRHGVEEGQFGHDGDNTLGRRLHLRLALDEWERCNLVRRFAAGLGISINRFRRLDEVIWNQYDWVLHWTSWPLRLESQLYLPGGKFYEAEEEEVASLISDVSEVD